MITEEDIKRATLSVLEPGLKPEDYYSVFQSDELPKSLAGLILMELRHDIKMRRMKEEHQRILAEMDATNEKNRKTYLILGIILCLAGLAYSFAASVI
jgi:hypothetical protein